jgi:hypothetical protein
MAKAVNFWSQDADGERWLVNGPELMIASNRPKKKGKRKMYANKPRHGTKAWMSYIRGFRKKNKSTKRKHHSKARRNMYSAGQIANPPRTRTVTRYVKAKLIRRRKSNPGGLFGRSAAGFLGLPGVEPILGAFAGLVVPPTLSHFTAPYLPTSITTSPWGKYAISAANVILPAWLIKKFLSRNIGNTMMVVGIGSLLYSIAKDFMPSVFGLSGYVGYQPMLGVYQQRRGLPPARQVPMMTTPMQSGIPSRLDPTRRF